MFQMIQRFKKIPLGLLIMINPLIFVPSVRNIPQVIEALNALPYDKFITRLMLEHDAYKTGRDFFLEHKEYTHIVICPDDLVINYDSFMELLRAVDDYKLTNLSGIANLDETNMNIFSCKPLGTDPTSKSAGTYYTRQTLPSELFIEVGFTGFACQFIERELVENLSFKGGCNVGRGCMDLQFTNELKEMGKPQIVYTDSFFEHLRLLQIKEVTAWKNKAHDKNEESTIFVKKGQKIEF
jgi:hypothetical protein